MPVVEREERPGPLAAQAKRAHPDRAHRHGRREEAQEIGAALDRDLHVLDDPLAFRALPVRVHRGDQAVAPVQRGELVVHVGSPVAARPQPADQRSLHAEASRAPEPVGVPPPQVVADGKEILLVPPDRLVVDLLPGVIAAPGRDVAERPDGQVQLARRERDPVDEVRAVTAQAALRRGLRDRVHAGFRRAERKVAQVHERLNRLEFDREGQGVAEGAVGVREAAEQGGVLVVSGGADDAAVTGEDLHLGHGLVRKAVAQRAGLDANPGHGTAERDRLELGHDQGHQPVPERGVGQVLVGGHAADPRRPALRVDPQDVAERGYIQGSLRSRAGLAHPEQVRRALGQPYRRARREGRVRLAQPGHRGLMRAGSHADILPVKSCHPLWKRRGDEQKTRSVLSWTKLQAV